METIVGIVIVLVSAGGGLIAMWKRGIANFWRVLAQTNELHGTSFATSAKGMATTIGYDVHKGGVLVFDQGNRKIAYVTGGGKSVEVLGYDFIQSWRVIWRERSAGGGAQFGVVTVGSADTRRDRVFLEVTTGDLHRPIIRMPMSSVRFAEESAVRLEIMINAKD